MKNLKDIKCFPIFVSSEIYQPINKNIFFIGDAFFAFPPTFAQGASQSIEVAMNYIKILKVNLINLIIKELKEQK